MKALFISEQILLDQSILSENINYQMIRPTLIKIQEMRIQPVLGSTLYNSIISQITMNTVSVVNQTLLDDYIQPAAIQWLYFEIPSVLAFRYVNKGMVRKSSEESTPMSVDEIYKLQDKMRNDAEWYSERITRFLIENRADYPEFNNPTNAIDTILPQATNYNTGLVLDTRPHLRGLGLDYPEGINSDIYGLLWR